MWVELEIPKSISTELPEGGKAYRLKNVYWNGRGLSEIEPIRFRGVFNVASQFSPLLTYDTNIPREIIAFEYGTETVFLIASSSALYTFIGSASTLDSTTPNVNNWSGLAEVPPVGSGTEKVVVFFSNWSTPKIKLVLASLQDGIILRSLFLSPPQNPPAVVATLDATKNVSEYTEFRYAYAYEDSFLNAESILSPVASVYAHAMQDNTILPQNRIFTEASLPSGVSKIRIYRATEKNPNFVLIAEQTSGGWFVDNNSADYVSFVTPKQNSVSPPVTQLTDGEWVMDRFFVAEGNVVYYSNVQEFYGFGFGIPYGGDNPLLGGFFRLQEPAVRLISWGSYCLVFTHRYAFRAIENEGVVVPVEFAIPVPYTKDTVKKEEQMLYIYSEDGLYVLTPNENIVTFRVNWRKLLSQYELTPDAMWVRYRRFYDREYVDVEFMYKKPANREFGFGYFRIDTEGNVSGMHTIDTWLG